MLAAIWTLHRDAATWPEATAFRPERWLPGGEALAPTDAHAYMPFGGGARQCIGFRFAQQELRIALAEVLSRFRVELEPGQVPLALDSGVTLVPKQGIHIHFQRRAPPMMQHPVQREGDVSMDAIKGQGQGWACSGAAHGDVGARAASQKDDGKADEDFGAGSAMRRRRSVSIKVYT